MGVRGGVSPGRGSMISPQAAPTTPASRPMARHRIFTTSVASVYPHGVAKSEKKGRTKAVVRQ